MYQIRGIKAEAVINYCEALITKEMVYHRFSRRVNKIDIKLHIPYMTVGRELKIVQIIGSFIEIKTL